jgi:hypothetical protein
LPDICLMMAGALSLAALGQLDRARSRIDRALLLGLDNLDMRGAG